MLRTDIIIAIMKVFLDRARRFIPAVEARAEFPIKAFTNKSAYLRVLGKNFGFTISIEAARQAYGGCRRGFFSSLFFACHSDSSRAYHA
jgi:hypothetical protein